MCFCALRPSNAVSGPCVAAGAASSRRRRCCTPWPPPRGCRCQAAPACPPPPPPFNRSRGSVTVARGAAAVVLPVYGVRRVVSQRLMPPHLAWPIRPCVLSPVAVPPKAPAPASGVCWAYKHDSCVWDGRRCFHCTVLPGYADGLTCRPTVQDAAGSGSQSGH